MLFDWYMDGDTPSQVLDGFKLSAPSTRFFDTIAAGRGGGTGARHLRALRALGRRRPSPGSPPPTARSLALGSSLYPFGMNGFRGSQVVGVGGEINLGQRGGGTAGHLRPLPD